ncbi:hypothetical protein E2C01_059025 [Portunus trituberculatus]|uniref:Uncharacterized protein n=1 Tax=Portunus trituberculatus TaxID=210409 RepID=A0A5B7H498_PORTR|nr:hypothetical protein [Portunus trituberculatus]
MEDSVGCLGVCSVYKLFAVVLDSATQILQEGESSLHDAVCVLAMKCAAVEVVARLTTVQDDPGINHG